MPDIAQQRARAEAFRNMHRGRLLLLPNVWDVATARIFEDSGFGAIATTSAGIAFALGYPDGERISRQEMLAAVGRIAAAVQVPVTADVEAGYGNRPEDAAVTARAVIEAGAVGMNLEDATGQPQNPLLDLSLQIEKIKAVLEEARRTGVPIVLNARTDVYLLQVGAPERRYELALKRLAAFRDAGADCLFVPGVRVYRRRQEVTWQGRHFGLTLTHRSRITAYERPKYFQDCMVRWRFRRFCHDHYFEARGGGTLMRDEMEFEAPLWAVGRVVERAILARQMRSLLRRRNRCIQETAEGGDWKRYVTS